MINSRTWRTLGFMIQAVHANLRRSQRAFKARVLSIGVAKECGRSGAAVSNLDSRFANYPFRNVFTNALARSGSIGFDQTPSCFIEEPTMNASASV